MWLNTIKKICRRIFEFLITLFCTTLIIFALIHLAPGDPIQTLYGRSFEIATSDTELYQEKVKEMHSEFGLDDSYPVQYRKWLKHLIRFDLGNSIRTGKPVGDEIKDRIPATVLLAVATIIIQIVLGLFFGILSALHAGGMFDNVVRIICVFFASIPGFFISLCFLSLFSVTMNLYKISNDATLEALWLPSLALALALAPQLIRVVRSNMLSEFGQMYILSAQSRGLSRRLLVKHALKNSALPIITMLAQSFAALLGGTVVIESIFAWPGIGKYALDSIIIHDYPAIQGYAFIMSFLVMCVNLIVDTLYVILDPQVRNKEGGTD